MLGKSITLDSIDTTVIGVMPVNFEFAPLGRSVDIWSTRIFEANNTTAEQARGGITYLIALARVRPDVSLDQAQAEMGVLDTQYRRDNPDQADADPRMNISLNQVQTLMVANVPHTGGAGPIWRRRFRAADRLRQCRQPASVPSFGAPQRDRGANGAGGQPSWNHSPTAYRKYNTAVASGAIGVLLSFWTTRRHVRAAG